MKPFFIAYVYPGWHQAPYRSDLDEWTILDNFVPYFAGHQPPARPLSGTYDDSKPEVTLGQIELAQSYGINAFTYFLYYAPQEFVLAKPIDVAYQYLADKQDFNVSLTWCLRLPHQFLPVRLEDRLADIEYSKLRKQVKYNRTSSVNLEGTEATFLKDTTIADIENLLDSDLLDELSINCLVSLITF